MRHQWLAPIELLERFAVAAMLGVALRVDPDGHLAVVEGIRVDRLSVYYERIYIYM